MPAGGAFLPLGKLLLVLVLAVGCVIKSPFLEACSHAAVELGAGRVLGRVVHEDDTTLLRLQESTLSLRPHFKYSMRFPKDDEL